MSTWLPRGILALAASFALAFPSFVLAADNALAASIRSLLDHRNTSNTASWRPGFAQHRAALRRFYHDRGHAPAWLDDEQAREVVAVLRSAGSHGLDARAYDIDWIETRLAERRSNAAAPAALDIAMTLALLRFLSEVHAGQIDPRSAGVRPLAGRRQFDPVSAIQSAREHGRLAGVAASAAPRWPMYAALQEVLGRYRVLATQPLPQPIPDGLPIRPGLSRPEVTLLYGLLIALGDLAPTEAVTDQYDGPIVEAVKRFQSRHGLDADGIVGRATRNALNEPMTARIRQIELALERARWLPNLEVDRAVGVNVPGFTLWAVDFSAGRPSVRLQSKVIVGRAPETRTPLFSTLVRGIELNPYWNVPESITRSEIVPRLRRDRAYLEREEMEIVTRETPPRVLPNATAETLEELEQGKLRLRQRPGSKNALGRLKLLMPNDLDIYLHDTPERVLFARARRDFSHGCIRVENIAGLAAFLLENGAGWDEARIRTAMQSDARETVRLPQPVPVVLFYTTVMVEPNGAVYFLPDIYGLDAILDAALAKRADAPR